LPLDFSPMNYEKVNKRERGSSLYYNYNYNMKKNKLFRYALK